MTNEGHQKDNRLSKTTAHGTGLDSFVLEKDIFSNIFEKDIKRVYIYKKAERLAKAIHLIGPAFRGSPALRERLDRIAVSLIDAAILPPASARDELARELLALSSVLSIAQTSATLSAMNAQLIAKEVHTLLQEIAGYEEPRLFLEEAPTLASLFRQAGARQGDDRPEREPRPVAPITHVKDIKGQKDTLPAKSNASRREAILAVLRSKGPSYIKDVSTVIRDVSEKTIQRELQALVAEGVVEKTGERRWTTYTLTV